MSKHTPGPWRSPREPNGKGHGWQAGPAWLGTEAYSEETAANARLIAAAPELLESLKLLMADERIGGPDGAKARAAIDKAEGKP